MMKINMIKTIIVEDEQSDSDLMINLLEEYEAIDIVAAEREIESGIAAIIFHKPDLIFLDINIYGRLSFEILDAVNKYKLRPKIVFTTAYNNYMNRAFKYAAFDYLLKPVDRNELKETIRRFKASYKQYEFSRSYEMLKSIMRKIIFGTAEGFEVVNPEDIVYISSVKGQSYAEVYLKNGDNIVITKNIGEVTKMLPESIFFRIHRSYILNLNYVKKVNRLSGKCFLQAENSVFEIPISREKSKLLKEKLKNEIKK